MRVVLASGSPRRRELIAKIPWLDVEIVTSGADERVDGRLTPARYAETLALRKARAAHDVRGGVVIGADTVVSKDEKIYGKPNSPAQATEFLRELCGGVHEVTTGVAVVWNGGEFVSHETTFVTLASFDEKLAASYVASGSPMDKAGGYGIQDEAFKPFVKSVEGDLDNVIGLPVDLLEKILKEKIG